MRWILKSSFRRECWSARKNKPPGAKTRSISFITFINGDAVKLFVEDDEYLGICSKNHAVTMSKNESSKEYSKDRSACNILSR